MDDINGMKMTPRLNEECWKRQHDELSKSIHRNLIFLLSFCLFSVLTISSPDHLLIGVDSSIDLPFAGVSVNYAAFLVIGPALLILQMINIEVYIDYWKRLGNPPSSVLPLPHIFNIESPLAKVVSIVVLKVLAPSVLLLFAWKAAPRAEGKFLFILFIFIVCALFGKHVIKDFSTARTKLISGVLLFIITFTLCYLVAIDKLNLNRSLMLYQSDLSGLRIENIDFSNANMAGVDLSNSIITTTNFDGADLSSASLLNTHISDSTLNQSNFEGARISNSTIIDSELNAGTFDETTIHDLRVSNSISRNLTVVGASLSSVIFDEVDLDGSDFSDSQIRESTFRSSTIIGGVFNSANISDTQFLDSHLSMATFQQSEIYNTVFEEITGIEMDFRFAKLSDVSILGGYVENTQLFGISGRLIDETE